MTDEEYKTIIEKPKRRYRKLLKVLAVLFALFVVFLAVAPYLIPTNSIRLYLIESVEKKTGGKCEIKSLKVDLFKGGLGVHGILLKDKDSNLMASVEEAGLSIDLVKLIQGRIFIDELVLNRAVINIVKDENSVRLLGMVQQPKSAGAKPSAKIIALSSTASTEKTKLNLDFKEAKLEDSIINFTDLTSGAKVCVRINSLQAKAEDLNREIAMQAKFDIARSQDAPSSGRIELAGKADLFENYEWQPSSGTFGCSLEKVSLKHMAELGAAPWKENIKSGEVSGSVKIAARNPSSIIGTGNLNTTQVMLSGADISFIKPAACTFKVTADAQKRTLNVDDLKVVDEMGNLQAKGVVSHAADGISAELNVIADAALHEFAQNMKESNTKLRGSLGAQGLVKITPADIKINANLFSKDLKLTEKGYPSSLPLEVLGNIQYSKAQKIARLEKARISSGDSEVSVDGGMQFGANKKPILNMNLKLSGEINAGKLHSELEAKKACDHMYFYGRTAVNAEAVCTDGNFVNIKSDIRSGDEDLRLKCDDPKNKLNVNFGALSCSMSGVHDIASKITKFDMLRIDSAPFKVTAEGNVSSEKESGKFDYRAHFVPAKATQLLSRFMPRDVATMLQATSLNGKMKYEDNKLRLTKTQATGSLKLEDKTYQLKLTHNLSIDLKNHSNISIRQASLLLTHKKGRILGVDVSGEIEKEGEGQVGKFEVNVAGSAAAAIAMLENAGKEILPEGTKANSDLSCNGRIDFVGTRVDGKFAIELNDFILSGVEPNQRDKTLFWDPRITGDLKMSYDTKGEAAIERISLATTQDAIALSGQVAAIRKDKVWNVIPSSAISVSADFSRASELMPYLMRGGYKAKSSGVTLVLKAQGPTDKLKLSCEAAADSIMISGKDIEPLSLADLNAEVRGVLQDEGTGYLFDIAGGGVTSKFAELSISGPLHLSENYELKEKTGVVFSFNANGEDMARSLPAYISGLGDNFKFDIARGGGVIVKSTTKPGSKTPYPILKAFDLQKGYFKANSLEISKRDIRDCKGRFSIEGAKFNLQMLRMNHGGFIDLAGSVDMNNAEPKCMMLVSTRGVNMPKVLGKQVNYARVLKGTLVMPDKRVTRQARFDWIGFDSETILKTLRVKDGSLDVTDSEIWIHPDLRNIIARTLDDGGYIIGYIERNQKKSLDKIKKLKIDEKVPFERISAVYDISDRKISIQESLIKQKDGATFSAVGTIGLPKKSLKDSKLNIKVYIIKDVLKFIKMEDVVGGIKNFDKIPKKERELITKGLPALIEKLGNDKKLFFYIKGSMAYPRINAKEIGKVLMYKGGGYALEIAGKALLNDKLKDFVPEGQHEVVDALGDMIAPFLKKNKKDGDDKKDDGKDNPFDDILDGFK